MFGSSVPRHMRFFTVKPCKGFPSRVFTVICTEDPSSSASSWSIYWVGVAVFDRSKEDPRRTKMSVLESNTGRKKRSLFISKLLKLSEKWSTPLLPVRQCSTYYIWTVCAKHTLF